MTIQQLEYIVALDKARHFVRAAESCGITQSTLSAMIQKLEEELDCKIFDRTMHPVAPTEIGSHIIKQAHVILFNVKQLDENIRVRKGTVGGSLSLAIIPTVAPYLLPGFIALFRKTYPEEVDQMSPLTGAVGLFPCGRFSPAAVVVEGAVTIFPTMVPPISGNASVIP